MSPAPANESSAFLSPFFVSSTAAAPLSERDCNGVFACPAVSKAPTAACAIRRGASFLDADDACLALSDKASFLIPEDSYLPGQENFAAAPCVPVGVPSVCRRCPTSETACVPFSPVHTVSTGIGKAGPRMTTPFLLDTPVFGGEEEFAAASICFEKAVQALEMVERPSVPRDPKSACLSVNASPKQAKPTVSGNGCSSGRRASGTDFDLDQNPDVQTTRRVSSLAPSPPASQLAGSGGDHFFIELPYNQVFSAPVASCGQDCTDAAESPVPEFWLPVHSGQESNTASASVNVSNPVSFTGSPTDAAAVPLDTLVPDAPAPVVRAFHHKTGGPCDHCGATESPQWRRGPPAKPMLCNACGTRFRRTNQLNPAASLSPASRAAATAAAAAAAPPLKRNAAKRDPPYIAGSSSKRGRSSAVH